MRSTRSKNKKSDIKNKIKNMVEPTVENFKSYSRVEIVGNNEALVEGCNGILEYDENIIRISTKRNEIKIIGKNLNLKCINPENVIVEGSILSIEFVD